MELWDGKLYDENKQSYSQMIDKCAQCIIPHIRNHPEYINVLASVGFNMNTSSKLANMVIEYIINWDPDHIIADITNVNFFITMITSNGFLLETLTCQSLIGTNSSTPRTWLLTHLFIVVWAKKYNDAWCSMSYDEFKIYSKAYNYITSRHHNRIYARDATSFLVGVIKNKNWNYLNTDAKVLKCHHPSHIQKIISYIANMEQ